MLWGALFAGFAGCAEVPSGHGTGRTQQALIELPALGGEVAISAPIPGPPRQHDINAVAAFNGLSQLVVWNVSGNLRAARLTSAGALLDPFPFDVWTDPDPRYGPTSLGSHAVAAVGSRFVVVFDDGQGIRGRFVDSSGVVDPAPFLIEAGAAYQEPAVLYDGARFATAYYRNSGSPLYSNDIVIERVGTDGTASGTPVVVALDVQVRSESRGIALAHGGGHYWLAWQRCLDGSFCDHIRLEAVRVTTDTLTVVDDPPLVVSEGWDQDAPRFAAVACMDTRCIVAWKAGESGGCDYGSFPVAEIRVLRFDAMTAAPIDAAPVTLESHWSLDAPRTVTSGSNFMVGWARHEGAVTSGVLRVNAIPPDPGRHPPSKPPPPPPPAVTVATFRNVIDPGLALSPLGENYALTWHWERAELNRDVFATRIDATGTPLDAEPTRLVGPTHTNTQSEPAVAHDRDQYLVAWRELVDGVDHVLAARVAPDGSVIDAPPLVFAMTTDEYPQRSQPQVTFHDGQFVVTWRGLGQGGTSDALFAARVTPQGQVLDDPPFQVSGQTVGIIGHGLAQGTAYLLDVWLTCPFDYEELTMADLDPTTPAASIRVVPAEEYWLRYSPPAATSDGSQPFVVWGYGGQMSARYGSAAFDVSSIRGGDFATTATGPGTFVVAWREATGALRVVSLAPPSGVGTALDLAPAGNSPTLANDAERVFIAWAEASGTSVAWIDDAATRVSPRATLPGASEPALSSRAPGEALLAYTRHEASLGVSRVFFRRVGTEMTPDGGSTVPPVDAGRDAGTGLGTGGMTSMNDASVSPVFDAQASDVANAGGAGSTSDSGQSGGNSGAAGTAGAPVASGTAGSEGGSPMESGEDAALPPDEETLPARTDDGCSCRLAPAREERGLSLLAIAVACFLLRSRGGNRHARRAGVARALRNL